MTGYESKKKAAQDKLEDDDTQIYQTELTKLLMESYDRGVADALEETKAALAQPAQEPVAYDKTEMNGFVQDLYDKKMQEGKHGHYETMFHVVHQAIKRATPPQRPWVDLTDEEIKCIEETTTCSGNESWLRNLTRSLEAKLKEKNT